MGEMMLQAVRADREITITVPENHAARFRNRLIRTLTMDRDVLGMGGGLDDDHRRDVAYKIATWTRLLEEIGWDDGSSEPFTISLPRRALEAFTHDWGCVEVGDLHTDFFEEGPVPSLRERLNWVDFLVSLMPRVESTVRDLRIAADMSRGGLARRIGADEASIEAYERGEEIPDDHARELGALFGVPVEFLRHGNAEVAS